MAMTDRKAFFGIHGWAGSGKSWLAQTIPGPRIVLDTEGGAMDSADRTDRVNRVQVWDPKNEALPTGLTDEDTVVVAIDNLDNVHVVMRLLETGNHPFESVILDSFSEMQAMLKTLVADPDGHYDPNVQFDYHAWGRLKNHGSFLMRQLRDLTRPSSPKPIFAVVVMYSDDESVPVVPLLEGGVRKALAGWFNLIGYLYTDYVPETKQEVRILQIARGANAIAKCNLHLVKVRYGTHIENPDLTEIANTLNGGN